MRKGLRASVVVVPSLPSSWARVCHILATLAVALVLTSTAASAQSNRGGRATRADGSGPSRNPAVFAPTGMVFCDWLILQIAKGVAKKATATNIVSDAREQAALDTEIALLNAAMIKHIEQGGMQASVREDGVLLISGRYLPLRPARSDDLLTYNMREQLRQFPRVLLSRADSARALSCPNANALPQR